MYKKKSAKNLSTNKNFKGQIFIQILYTVPIPLSDYAEKVQDKKWIFPSFFECCPICHGNNCPVRIGYYYRTVIDLRNKLITSIPIARYKCTRKKKARMRDRTFSLLPDTLIPYYALTIDSFMHIITLKEIHAASNHQALDYVYNSSQAGLVDFCERSLLRYYVIFSQTIIKLKHFLHTERNIPPPSVTLSATAHLVQYINTFYISDQDGIGVIPLSRVYYASLGSYIRNARFLIGTPCQFR